MPSAIQPVGFFDSGLGGISVLRAARTLLPKESYLYFGDSANAPYGVKSGEDIRALSLAAAERLLSLGAKAIVVACNTATGEAIDHLRRHFPEVPLIGVEPAIKPAVLSHPGEKILVLATPQCLRSCRVTELLDRYRDRAEILPVPCGGLMEFVEQGELDSPALRDFLRALLAGEPLAGASAAVLGCTHYPFLSGQIASVLGPDTELIDGNAGIAAQLKRRLEESGLLNPGPEDGTVTFYNSLPGEEILLRSRQLLELP